MKRAMMLFMLFVALVSLGFVVVACGEDLAHGADEPGDQDDVQKSKIGDVRIGPDEPIMMPTEEIDWRPGPDSLEEGAEYAVLEGDPTKNELFTMRLRLPDGFRIMPHTHPTFERVTVLSGTFHFAHGDTFEPDEARPYPPGSYIAMPPRMEHFASAQGETVIQLTSIGPWRIDYINPEHDPRKREE